MGSVSAQAGDVGFAIQPTFVGKTGSYTGAGYKWYRVDPLRVQMDVIQGDQIMPPEVSPDIFPKSAYKDSRYGAGQADLYPRLENGFGALLWALMGNVSSVTGVNADGSATSNVNAHVINFAADRSYQPYMAWRRLIPAYTGSAKLGDTFFDAKIANARITVGAMGKIAVRVTMVARDFVQAENPSWTWFQDYEDPTATPESGAGYLKIAGTEYPITGAIIEVDNGLTSPNQEMTVGDFTPDDFTALYRTASMRFVYKWSDPGLYEAIRNGSSGATTWTNLPKLFQTAGANFAFEASFQTPKVIPSSSPATNFELRIRGNNMVIAPDGPIELVGATLLQQSFTATLLKPTSGDYLQFVLVNGTTSYAA